MTEHKENTPSKRGGARPGAGPPTILKDAKRMGFIIDAPTKAQIEAYADRHSCSKSQAVRELIYRGGEEEII